MNNLDETGEESRFYDELGRLLALEGVRSFRFDMPQRHVPGHPKREDDKTLRCARLQQVIQQLDQRPGDLPTAWLGVSFGGQILLDLLSAPEIQRSGLDPNTAILVGCVVEHPPLLPHPTPRFILVYGREDYIRIDDTPGLEEPIGPEDYGPVCAENLAQATKVLPTLHILEGLDHLLQPTGETAPPIAPARIVGSIVRKGLLFVSMHGVRAQ